MLKVTASPALRRVGFVGLLTLCLSVPAHAQWKWKDAAGKVQYSDLAPPPGTPDKDILQRPAGQKLQVFVIPPAGSASAAAAPAPVASGPSKADQDAQARQKQQEQEQAANQKEQVAKQAQQKRENCSRAQDNLKMLQDGVRINRLNEKGERVILDDAQRAEEMRRTQGTIASECR